MVDGNGKVISEGMDPRTPTAGDGAGRLCCGSNHGETHVGGCTLMGVEDRGVNRLPMSTLVPDESVEGFYPVIM